MKILLPVDNADASEKAVRFAGKFLAPLKTGVDITLIHVVESIPEFLIAHNGGTPGEVDRKVADEWEAKHKTAGNALLERHRQTLIAAGIPQTAIHVKLVVRECRPEAKKTIAAISIIDEMSSGDYSVVCLGRRNAAAAEAGILGSVAEKVLREADGRTVWVVD